MKEDTKRILIRNIPFIMIFYVFNKIGWLFSQTNSDVEVAKRVWATVMYIDRAFKNPLPSFLNITALLFGLGAVLLFKGIFYIKAKNKKKFRHGEEYGSARWGNRQDIAPLMDNENPKNNIKIAEGIGLKLTGKVEPKYQRNHNVFVVGGSGSGKTRFFVKPNLMQKNSSYVITDPKGTTLPEVGKMLANGKKIRKVKCDKNGNKLSDRNGNPIYEMKDGKPVYERDAQGHIKHETDYVIKILNTKDLSLSHHFNPFVYIKKTIDILTLVDSIVANTTGKGDKTGEDFWVKAEKLLLQALIGLIWEFAPENEMNFRTLLEYLDAFEVHEDDESFKNAVDMVFEEIENDNPSDPPYCVRMYKKFKLAAGKTAKSILISVAARLAPFDDEEVKALFDYDELELEKIGKRKTALFVVTDDTKPTFDFIGAMMYCLLFNIMVNDADSRKGGRLKVPVQMLLDEFANIKIPNFEHVISTIRSRDISACIVVQSKAQLKSQYKDDADTIEDNCDTELFLGGKSKTTTKDLADALGKETIDLMNTSDTRGTSQSYGQNYQKTGRDLADQSEINRLERDLCIVQISGLPPFKVKKTDITKCPHYKQLADDPSSSNYFDIREYITCGRDNTEIDEYFATGAANNEEIPVKTINPKQLITEDNSEESETVSA